MPEEDAHTGERAQTPGTLAPHDAADGPQREPTLAERWRLSVVLFLATFASTTYVGATADSLWSGLAYSVPLLAILLSHELGHYIAARIHRVPASPPFFIPLPLPPLGTMGAVILMPDRITRRNALLDVGAAGPLAGLVVALPVLAYGIAESPVQPIVTDRIYLQEGHSLLYKAMLYAIKGPIPEGYDIFLSSTAFAGWAGLFVTMLNLIPAVQLDGGHVAHALLGERHERVSRVFRAALLPGAALAALYYGGSAFLEGARGDALWHASQPGLQWLVWFVLLHFMARAGKGREHPPTDDAHLSPRRRLIAYFTLGLFVLLFMPAWLRVVVPV
jgi:membrane-associated protease RseP (regulator of RpoE activity)